MSEKNQKIAGVLGGMGPDATVDFMARVLAVTPAGGDEEHVHLLVDQNPDVPNRQAAILEDGDDPRPALAEMAVRLEAAGADFLVMPCNTAHVFSASIRAAVNIPLVSIVDITVEEIEKTAVPSAIVGVLATAGCVAGRLYQDALEAAGFGYVLPDGAELQTLAALNGRIKSGDTGTAVAVEMRGLADALVQRGAEIVIAACTEIPLVLDASVLTVPLISTTDVLARRTVALAKES